MPNIRFGDSLLFYDKIKPVADKNYSFYALRIAAFLVSLLSTPALVFAVRTGYLQISFNAASITFFLCTFIGGLSLWQFSDIKHYQLFDTNVDLFFSFHVILIASYFIFIFNSYLVLRNPSLDEKWLMGHISVWAISGAASLVSFLVVYHLDLKRCSTGAVQRMTVEPKPEEK